MTGIEVAKVLVSEATNLAKRIIMLTAKGQEKDRAEASAIGIHRYLVKPFSPRELLEKVEAVLEGTAPRESTQACGVDSKVSRI